MPGMAAKKSWLPSKNGDTSRVVIHVLQIQLSGSSWNWKVVGTDTDHRPPLGCDLDHQQLSFMETGPEGKSSIDHY